MSPQEVKNAASLCARTACDQWYDNMKHRDTALLYCRRCARLINEACKTQLVTKAVQP